MTFEEAFTKSSLVIDLNDQDDLVMKIREYALTFYQKGYSAAIDDCKSTLLKAVQERSQDEPS